MQRRNGKGGERFGGWKINSPTGLHRFAEGRELSLLCSFSALHDGVKRPKANPYPELGQRGTQIFLPLQELGSYSPHKC